MKKHESLYDYRLLLGGSRKAKREREGPREKWESEKHAIGTLGDALSCAARAAHRPAERQRQREHRRKSERQQQSTIEIEAGGRPKGEKEKGEAHGLNCAARLRRALHNSGRRKKRSQGGAKRVGEREGSRLPR